MVLVQTVVLLVFSWMRYIRNVIVCEVVDPEVERLHCGRSWSQQPPNRHRCREYWRRLWTRSKLSSTGPSSRVGTSPRRLNRLAP